MPGEILELPEPERLGGHDDVVQLFLTPVDGTPQRFDIYEDYQVKLAVLQQPAAFSLRLGWSGVAQELLNYAKPGTLFELRIKGVVVQSGKTDARELVQEDGGTFVELRGRDFMAAVYDSFVLEERSFADKTYYDLTRTVLDICGLTEPDHGLIAANGSEDAANQKAITGFQTVKVVNEETVREVETGAAAGTSKVVQKTLKAKLGERWYDWLQRQYKLAGLFLRCTGEGNFVIGTPTWDKDPAYTILKSRQSPTHEFSTVLRTSFKDDTTNRHSEVIVYGRGGGGAAGRTKVTGRYTDPDMFDFGLLKPMVVHDDDCKTAAQCEFVARRMAAEERRAGWQLTYTLSGHTVPSLKGSGDAIWYPDQTVRVIDDEIPIDGTLWIEDVEFARKPDTTTTITLMRQEDLVFAKEEQANRKAPKLRRHPKG